MKKISIVFDFPRILNMTKKDMDKEFGDKTKEYLNSVVAPSTALAVKKFIALTDPTIFPEASTQEGWNAISTKIKKETDLMVDQLAQNQDCTEDETKRLIWHTEEAVSNSLNAITQSLVGQLFT